jgi:hypothetical protein
MPVNSIPGSMMVPAFDSLAFTASPGCTQQGTNSDNTAYTKKWLYNATGVALVAGRIFKVVYDGDEETNPKVIVCTASPATTPEEVAVALAAVPAASWAWFAVQGYVNAYVNGDSVDVAKDDFLKIVVGTDDDAFVGNTTTRTTNSHAIATEAETTATPASHRVYLLGDPALLT